MSATASVISLFIEYVYQNDTFQMFSWQCPFPSLASSLATRLVASRQSTPSGGAIRFVPFCTA